MQHYKDALAKTLSHKALTEYPVAVHVGCFAELWKNFKVRLIDTYEGGRSRSFLQEHHPAEPRLLGQRKFALAVCGKNVAGIPQRLLNSIVEIVPE